MTDPKHDLLTIFSEAIARDSEEERSRYLDEACQSDPTARERIDSLIRAHFEERKFLGGASPTPAAIHSSSIAELGTQIGPYKILQQIGEGGMGVVFLAEQEEPVRRQVALKIIKPGMDSEQVVARFEAERQALALMDHPNIARVLDAGTTKSGLPFFAMDLVKGAAITEYCNQNQLTLTARLVLFQSVCDAIRHAHQKGVIHRDIKPSNVLVALHNAKPVPKVIDFGIAKATHQSLTERSLSTGFGQFLGTAEYMSPEQAEMSGLDVDTRSDIYSLGVLLYELLTDFTPFDRDQVANVALDEVRRIIREEDPPKPSTKLSQSGNRLPALAADRSAEPSKLSRMIQGELDWIVMKSLEKDRTRRYETASGFAADIQRYLNDEPVVACPPSTRYRLGKFARRNRTALATTAMVGMALLLGTIVSISQAIRANRQSIAASENEQQARQQTSRALKSEHQLRESREDLREELYASNMNLAAESFAVGDINRMTELVDEHRPVSAATDRRGFEWYLWWRAGHLSRGWARNTRRGQFHNLAVSPDGTFVAANDYNASTIHVYDRDSMRLICSPLPAGTPFDRLRFTPDGRFLVAAHPSRSSIRLYDTETWGHTLTLDAGPSSAMAFARQQSLLVTDGRGQITLWDTRSWQRADSLPTQDHSLHLALNPAGTKLVRSVRVSPMAGGLLDRIELWDLEQRRVIRTLNRYKIDNDEEQVADRYDEIAFSPDGKLLAIGYRDGTVRIWTAADLFAEGDEPRPIQTYAASTPIESLAFAPDSARLTVGTSLDNAVLVWDLNSDNADPIATIRGHADGVNGVAFAGDSNTVCSCAWDGYVKTWDLSDCRPYDVVRHVEAKSHAGYSADGRLIYLDIDGAIRHWHVTKRESRRAVNQERSYSHISLSADGRILAGITQDEEQLRVWNLENDNVLYESSLEHLKRPTESRSHPSGLSRFVVSTDGRLVACLVPRRAGAHGRVVLVNSEDGSIVGDAHELSFMKAWPAFSPSGQQIVTQGYMDPFSRVSVIKADALLQRLRIRGGPGIEMCAAFDPSGATLAIGTASGDIRLHDTASGEPIQVLKGHTEPVTTVTFSRNADRLASGGRDGTVRIWRRGRSGYHRVSTLRGQAGTIHLVAFAPNSASLAAVIGDDTIQVWRSASSQEVTENVDAQLIRAEDDLHTAPARALTELDDALLQAATPLRGLTLRGRVHNRLGDWRSAVVDWTAALRLDPNNHYFLQSRARAFALGRQWKQAVADWNQLVRLTNERNGEYLLERGACYLHMGRRDNARADLLQALAQTASVESVERVLSLLGFVEMLVPAGSQWRYATGSHPSRNWASRSYDDSKWRTGWTPFGTGERDLPTRTDWGDQDLWLRHAFELDHAEAEPLVLHLRADEEAEVFLNGVLAAKVGSTVTNTNYKRVYQVAQCGHDARLRPGKNVLAVHCQNQDWRSYVDVALYVQANPSDIEATLISAAKHAPSNAVLSTALAVRYVEQHKWNDAAIQFHRSAKLSPGRDLSWIWAAFLYCHSGELEGFHQLTTDMLEQFGETHSPHRALDLASVSLVAQPSESNLERLVKLVDTALQADLDDHEFRRAQMAKALIEYRRGNDQDAIEWAHQCQALEVLALAHARTGEIELARQEIAKLRQSLQGKPAFYTHVRKTGLAFEVPLSQMLLREVLEMVATQ